MWSPKLHPNTSLLTLAALVILFAALVPIGSAAQQHGQKTFASPEDASHALAKAAQDNDEHTMIAILGPDARQIVSSGDDAEDAESRANFVAKFKEMHRLVSESATTAILYIGGENWPTPIPLVKAGESWYFDTEAGKKEILYRRIGRNEISAIRICDELVKAQKEYHAEHNGEYAQRIFSDEGQHNGLYWTSLGWEPQSPIGPLVASAVVKRHNPLDAGNPTPTPFRGYYFEVITRQGKNAQGGAKTYIENGKMKKGFAFLAYPAEYGSTGVMAFMVNENGVVLQKDLGPNTNVIDKMMKAYNPDKSWQKTGEPKETAENELIP